MSSSIPMCLEIKGLFSHHSTHTLTNKRKKQAMLKEVVIWNPIQTSSSSIACLRLVVE